MSLHRASRAHVQRPAPSLAGSGGWANVVVAADGLVRVTYPQFDGGVHVFGPLPFWTISGTPPDVGDRVWLLVDSQGEPQLALAA